MAADVADKKLPNFIKQSEYTYMKMLQTSTV